MPQASIRLIKYVPTIPVVVIGRYEVGSQEVNGINTEVDVPIKVVDGEKVNALPV